MYESLFPNLPSYPWGINVPIPEDLELNPDLVFFSETGNGNVLISEMPSLQAEFGAVTNEQISQFNRFKRTSLRRLDTYLYSFQPKSFTIGLLNTTESAEVDGYYAFHLTPWDILDIMNARGYWFSANNPAPHNAFAPWEFELSPDFFFPHFSYSSPSGKCLLVTIALSEQFHNPIPESATRL